MREVLEGVCAIYRGLVFVLDGEELTHPRGVVELLEARLVEPIAEPFVFRGVSERATIDVAACFDARPPQRRIQTFANLQETFEHGAHLMGFHEAVTSVLGREPSLTTAPIPDFRKAYRAALVLVLAVDFEPIDYAGPTKGRVHTPELRGIVARALMEPLSRYFGGHGSAIVASFRQTATNAQ